MTRSTAIFTSTLLLLLALLVGADAVAMRTPALSSKAPSTATPSTAQPPSPATPLCNQEQLIVVADTLMKLDKKLQCQAEINEREMMKTSDPLVVCNVPSCVAALQTMYRTLPTCLFRDWDVHHHAEMLLRNCAIVPEGAEDDPASDVSCDDDDGNGDSNDDSDGDDSCELDDNDSRAESPRASPSPVGPSPSRAPRPAPTTPKAAPTPVRTTTSNARPSPTTTTTSQATKVAPAPAALDRSTRDAEQETAVQSTR